MPPKKNLKTEPAADVSISLETLRQLMPLAAQIGIDLPVCTNHQPYIQDDGIVRNLARDLGGILSSKNIFRKDEKLIAINLEDAPQPVTTARFVTWVDSHVSIQKWSEKRGNYIGSLDKKQAEFVLNCDDFMVQIRKIEYTFQVSLPVIRQNGELELLAKGYDDETRSWNSNVITYQKDMELSDALKIFEKYLAEWPWGDVSVTPGMTLRQSRDAAIILAGMFGNFMRVILGVRSKMPGLAASGNQPGTGKTTLCKMCIAPIFGLPPEMTLPSTEEKFERLLETMALGREPVLFLDDIGRMIRSGALNKFITSSKHGGTKLYTQEKFEIDNVTQVFMTGNDLPIEENLKRRLLWCELFLPTDVQGREFTNEVTDYMLDTHEWRAEMLGAMWAVVREWWRLKRDGTIFSKRHKIKSFERYCEVIGEIMDVLDWADPFAPSLGISGGDKESGELELLIKTAANSCNIGQKVSFTVSQLVDIARSLEILEYRVGIAEDGPLDKKSRVGFGKVLSRYKGRILQRVDGVYFSFGRRNANGGSSYDYTCAKTREELE